VTFALGVAILPPSSFAATAFSDVASMIAPFLAGAACLYAAMRGVGRNRQAWACIAAACVVYGVGDAIWAFYEIVLRSETPFPSFADAAYLGMIPLMFLGLALLSPTARGLASFRTALDAVTVIGAATAGVWQFVLRPTYEASDVSLLAKSVGAAYPAGDLVLFFGLFLVLYRYRGGRAGVVLAVFSGGLAIFMASDIAFAYLTLNDTYATGSIVDLGWPIGFALMGYAGVVQGLWGPEDLREEREAVSAGWRQSLPLGLLLAIVAVLVGAGISRSFPADPILAAILLAVTVSVVIRQSIVMMDNAALNKELSSVGEQLERRVMMRTIDLQRALGEQHLAAADLRRSEERFRRLVQNSSDMITALDAAGSLTYTSPSVEQIMGYSPDDWVGTNILELIHPDDRARAAVSLAGVMEEAGVHPATELRVRHHDGTYRHLEMVANNLLDDPAVPAVMHHSRDVTQRREAEEALRESELRFRSLAEHSPVGIYQLTPAREVVYLNPAALTILEADDVEALTRVPFERFFTSESLETMRVEHAKRAFGSASTYEVETVGLRGTRRNLLVSGAPLLDAEGELHALIGTMIDITERKRSEEALREREEEFRSLFADNPHPMWVYDVETLEFLEVNDATVETYGYTRDEFLRMRITDIRPQEAVPQLITALNDRPTLQHSGEWQHRTRDGRIIDVEITSHLKEFAGRPGALVIALDVTERKRAQRALEVSEERFRSLVHHASDLITVIRPDTTVLYQSPSIEGILGYKADAVIGHALTDIVHRDDVASLLAFLAETISKPDASAWVETRLRHRNGSWSVFEIVGSDRTGDPAIGGFVLNTRDLSERKLLEDQLRDQAFHDPLTKLANRARFSDRLEHALERGGQKGAQLAVLFIDLDNFKAINDSLGHAAGDQILTEVAARLQSCLRQGDTAARYGGDEFAILVEDLAASGQGLTLGERIVEEVRRPFEIDGRQVFISASVGVTEAGGDQAGDDIVRNADVAMYVAKSRGKSRCEPYETRMHESMARRLALVADLQRALELREFVLEYQPTVVLATGELRGVEALVRWEHPERGRILPAEFIPLAEESGAIGALGHWVLVTACRQAKQWETKYAGGPALSMNVNVSVRQLQQPAFADEVASVLRETEISPENLVLEVTESVMMQDVDAIVPVLKDLKGLGVRLAIDDFGTGYSSLSYLAQFPFDILKIDKSFVDGTETSGNRLDLTQAIVELGKTLHLEIVAEGIEREDQAVALRRVNCDLGQGYLFSRPLPAEQFEQLLLAARRDAAA
jgi:diguanylate cyclase (GGDEF)-like protein/PAS domain S-box-containing protein